MSLIVNFLNETDYFCDHKLIRRELQKEVAAAGVEGVAEINVSLVGENTMVGLHERFMKTAEVTDVLSFPLYTREEIAAGLGLDPEGRLRLGDVVICIPVARAQAGENGRSTDEEVVFLAVHGCRHLLGFHHEEND